MARTTEGLTLEDLLEGLDQLESAFAIYKVDQGLKFANRAALEAWPVLYSALLDGVPRRDATRMEIQSQFPDLPPEKLEAFTDFAYASQLSPKPNDISTSDNRTFQVFHQELPSGGLAVGVGVEVTELRQREKDLKAAREEAERANRLKSEFLATMSHEIRTPLNGILGMAQALSLESLTSEQRDMVSTITESGKTLMSILNDVLDLSKVEAGKMDITPVPGDLSHAMRRLVRFWLPRAREKGITLHLDIAEGLPAYLTFDPVRVRQCVSNLMSNALKFTPKGRVDLRLTSEPVGEGRFRIQIAVEDSGIGMTADQVAGLFSDYGQVNPSTRQKEGGTGLGLAISRRLARLMGGDITAESEPGKGSLFTLSLELAAAEAYVGDPAPVPAMSPMPSPSREAKPAPEAAAVPDAPPTSASLRVLLVDDNAINRQVARLLMEPSRYDVVEAADGVEALAILAEQTFDLVLLDMHMPKMDGPETVKHLRASNEAWAGVPVIALTADAMSGDRERYIAMGMQGYVPKPINANELASEMNRVLAEQASGSAPRSALKNAV